MEPFVTLEEAMRSAMREGDVRPYAGFLSDYVAITHDGVVLANGSTLSVVEERIRELGLAGSSVDIWAPAQMGGCRSSPRRG